MAEVEEEVSSYHSNRDSSKYANIKERISQVTRRNKHLKPKREANINLKYQYNKRLGELWKEFETRSDSLSDILQQNSSKTSMERRLIDRKQAEERFSKELSYYIFKFLATHFRTKFSSDVHLRQFSDDTVARKIIGKEVANHANNGLSWAMFHVSESTRKQVERYLQQKVSAMPDA